MGGGVTGGERGTKTPSGRDHVELDLGALAGVTDRGRRHERNEDAMGVPEAEALASPRAHQITRWLGQGGRTQDPAVTSLEPGCDGVVLLCSDGLWNYLPEPAGLAALALPAALTDPVGAAGRLVAFALEAGGEDNITVVLARFPHAPASDPRSARNEPPARVPA